MPVNPSPATPLPTPPSTTSPGNFDTRADNFLSALPTYQTQLDSIADVTYDNAVEAAASATAANTSAINAAASATSADTSADNAATSEANALAYAQAAGASAGVPAPPSGVVSYFQTNTSGGLLWGSAPVDASKLDKQGGIANKLSFPYVDLGTIAANGTATLDANTATVFRVQAAGTITVALTNLPTGLVSTDIEILCVNFGGKTVNFDAGNWIKPDGSFAATPAAAGVTFQTSGTDRVLAMIDNGTKYYKVMR